MKETRQSVFETNSSSTHCIVINPKKDFEKNFKMKLNDKGEIEVDGWDQNSEYCAYGFYEKLAYMLSWMYLRENDNPAWDDAGIVRSDFAYPSDDFDSSYEDEYELILETIQERFPEVKGIRLTNVSNIEWDHQTMPYESDFVIDIWNREQLEGYLFNDDALVRVGRD